MKTCAFPMQITKQLLNLADENAELNMKGVGKTKLLPLVSLREENI